MNLESTLLFPVVLFLVKLIAIVLNNLRQLSVVILNYWGKALEESLGLWVGYFVFCFYLLEVCFEVGKYVSTDLRIVKL